MSEQPKNGGITWTNTTWNPIRGCTRVSQGCVNCYAERVAARFCGPGHAYDGLARITPSGPRWTGEVRFVEEHLLDPLRWKRPRKIFVNSMSDLFHNGVTDEQLDRIFAVMALAPRHTFQVLTKRAERMRDYWGDLRRRLLTVFDRAVEMGKLSGAVPIACGVLDGVARPLPNVWLGVSCEDQATANERIPLLLDTPAAVRWVSAEPLLEAINLCAVPDQFTRPQEFSARYSPLGDLDWVVVGGESGPGARPMHPQWALSLRDQCLAAGVPFFFKQWGEWVPTGGPGADGGGYVIERVGKKGAGDLLDGRQWHEFPEVKP